MDKSTQSPTSLAHSGGRMESGEGEAGFTLVEMLVVITIIGLVMSLVGPRVLSYLSDSKVKAAKIQIESFSALWRRDGRRLAELDQERVAIG